MATQFNLNNNFDSIVDWLKNQLNSDTPLITPNNENKLEGNSKGICFWFMKVDGYSFLSKLIPLNPITPLYSKDINGETYDLIYLETALRGEEIDNIYLKLNSHFIQNHTSELICKGNLSSLRSGLGSLLSDDLINPLTKDLVDGFMKNYMKVFCLELETDNAMIDNDRIRLIEELKPLFNIKNNPNAKIIGNPTHDYKKRRAKIYINTRRRLKCNDEIINNEVMNIPNLNTPSFIHQSHGVKNNTTEFFVLRNQDISRVIRGIESIGIGANSIRFFNANNLNMALTLFTNNGNTITNRANNPDSQNAYSYFLNVSNNYGPPHFNRMQAPQPINGQRRFIIIQQWMNHFNCEEIIVQVTRLV
jgi:hypothetical protein